MNDQSGKQQPKRLPCKSENAHGEPCSASRKAGSAYCSRHQHLAGPEPKPDRCQAITASGKACPTKPLPGKRHCLMHDPESAELRREAARQGGRNSSNQARLAKAMPLEALTTQELRVALSRVFVMTITGQIEPALAHAASTVARTISELEMNGTALERLEELEKLAGERMETRALPAYAPVKWWEQEDSDEQG